MVCACGRSQSVPNMINTFKRSIKNNNNLSKEKKVQILKKFYNQHPKKDDPEFKKHMVHITYYFMFHY